MNPLKIIGLASSHSKSAAKNAHMTWAAKTAGHSLSRTRVFLKQNIWVFPLLATVVLALVAYTTRRAIEATMKENLKAQIQSVLNVQVGMLDYWIKVQNSNASSLANSQAVRQPIYELLKLKESKQAVSPDADAALQQQIAKALRPMMTSHNYIRYLVTDRDKRIIASDTKELMSQQAVPEYDAFLSKALAGEATVSPPFPSIVPLKDETGKTRTGVPTMYVSAPVRDENFEVVAVLGLRIRPELEMTRIMQAGQIGETGETYAFDKNANLVSSSRFDDQLILLGLLADHPDAKSILNVQLRDPGGNLTTGYRPKVRRSELPLTAMAEAAVAGKSGFNIEGYRDYRGVPTIGAWRWLPKYDMGLATEMDVAEAFHPLHILQWTFLGLFLLMAASSIAIFIFTIIVARLRREAQKATIEAKQLGQYSLETKLGAGAMGVVYKGHHSMLRRPTAIKLLEADKLNDASISRFEREVQITCQLNHPNTVAIYDYGRTPDGVFYYAMEYLDGISLQAMVDTYGPQSEGRVIHILQQLCGSLYEAHSLGLVHRDIKPANLMLNRRGCEADVLKVLDFGLVKALDEEKHASTNQQSPSTLTGTPLYMAPESIQSPNSVDGRSDLYAVGAVGYFLLTGKPVFTASSIVELCHQHIDVTPIPPSERLGRKISEELEDAILKCLEKSRSKRPATARDLAQMLARCPTANQWTEDDAEAWWGRHERGQAHPLTPANTGKPSTAANLDRTMISDGGD